MKKLFLFAAAFAALTFASSCSKEDESTDTPSSEQETLTVGNITVPKDGQILEARSVTASWSKSTSAAEGSTMQYEAFLSGDGGSTWTSLGTSKLCSAQIDDMESDKVYQFKVKTTCTDASGNVTTAETEPNKFVAYYKKGTAGASVTTENSITMEWGNLIPFDTVYLELAYNHDTDHPLETVSVTEGNTYTFQNLVADGKYRITYKLIKGDNAMSGQYYAETIDNSDKQFTNTQYGSYPIYVVDGKQWINILGPIENCWFEPYEGLTNFAYGVRVATEQDWQDLERFCGMPEDEISQVSETRGMANGVSKKISEYLNQNLKTQYDKWGFLTYDSITNQVYVRYFLYSGAVSRRLSTNQNLNDLSFEWFIKEL